MKIIVIVGPTAVGKSKVSVELAKIINAEIISGDSVQVYKKLDIGSGKITETEMDDVPHHLIDFLEITESYSVSRFQKEVRKKIEEIKAREKNVIICGGTGLYIKAALTNYQLGGGLKRDRDFSKKYISYSNEELHDILTKIDYESSLKFHQNNRARVLRAVEYHQKTGSKISDKKDCTEDLYDYKIIGLGMKREKLYDKINQRVDDMFSKGLINEVESLYNLKNNIDAIGYNELFEFLDQKISLEESTELIKRNSRRYAKRQFTWFNNQMDTNWIDVYGLSTTDVLDKILKLIN